MNADELLPADVGDESVEEKRLRLLHALIGNLREGPHTLKAYVELLRSMRERLHPIGAADHRLIRTAAGLTFRINLGDRLGSDFYYGYDVQRLDTELFTALVDPGHVVVDAGANFGYYTVLTSVAAGPAGMVHAFEPDPDAFKLLSENVALNSLNNTHRYDVCLGVGDRDTDFYLMEESAFSGLSPTGRARPRATIRTKMRSLDSLLAEQGQPTVSRMKIDVEGHEYAVLAGARETIRRSRDVIVVMIEVSAKNLTAERRGMLDAELRELAGQGFRGWVAGADEQGRLRLEEVSEIASLPSANVLLAREGSPAQSRLLDAVRVLGAPPDLPEGGSLLRRLRDREAAAAALVAEQLSIVQDRDAKISALIAELAAARTELLELRARFETRLGARLRRLERKFRG